MVAEVYHQKKAEIYAKVDRAYDHDAPQGDTEYQIKEQPSNTSVQLGAGKPSAPQTDLKHQKQAVPTTPVESDKPKESFVKSEKAQMVDDDDIEFNIVLPNQIQEKPADQLKKKKKKNHKEDDIDLTLMANIFKR